MGPALPALPGGLRGAWLGLALALAGTVALLRPPIHDPDSALYAAMSSELARAPVARWLEPRWVEGRAKAGPFLEHTAVSLWPGAALEAVGVPAGALVANALAGVLLLFLLGRLAGALQPGARALAWAAWGAAVISVQYWLRANHEAWWALGVVGALLPVARGRHPAWVAPGVALACAVKGALGADALLLVGALALALRGPRAAAAAVAWGALGGAAAVGAYELAYRAATGQSFLAAYLAIQLDYVAQLEAHGWWEKPGNLGKYLLKLAGLAAPGALLLLWQRRRSRAPAVAGLLGGIALTLLATSLMTRHAVRYVFPCYPLLCVAGAVAAAPTRLGGWLEARPRAVLAAVGLVALARVALGDLVYRDVNLLPGGAIQQRRDAGAVPSG